MRKVGNTSDPDYSYTEALLTYCQPCSERAFAITQMLYVGYILDEANAHRAAVTIRIPSGS